MLAGAGTVSLWRGDLDAAQHYVERSYRLAEANAMGPLMAIGRCRKAVLTIVVAVCDKASTTCRPASNPFTRRATNYSPPNSTWNWRSALLTLGQAEEGLDLVNKAIDRVNGSGELFQLPELLRVKGKLLCALPQSGHEEAERAFQQSIDLARAQHAGSWELRTATDLAELMASTGDRIGARALLQRSYGRFTEGFETADLKVAADLLSTLA